MSATASPSAQTAQAVRRFPSLAASLELLKPITWFPPMWAFMCGAVSSGASFLDNWHLVLGGIVLSGPLVCAMSQAINDWHDRHVDAINEPERPIPSGRVPGRWGLYIAILWSCLSLAWAALFGYWVLAATVIGIFMAWAYSAPPFRLKLNGWYGNTAVAFSYEGLAWFTGAAILFGGLPDYRIIALAVLYSIGAHGIMTLNDFKSVAGDREMNVRTLPVQLGEHRAAMVASVIMTIPQLVVIGLLVVWNLPSFAVIVCALLAAQIFLMVKYLGNRDQLLAQPKRNAALYNATGTTLYVLGMLASAIGVGSGLGGIQ
ncbi:MAG: chlorophyll synthase ChlG [Rhizobiaceae bacterium]|nr:chlorophyll synthase ChlG [Rhizobiaceae bacterium]